MKPGPKKKMSGFLLRPANLFITKKRLIFVLMRTEQNFSYPPTLSVRIVLKMSTFIFAVTPKTIPKIFKTVAKTFKTVARRVNKLFNYSLILHRSNIPGVSLFESFMLHMTKSK